MKQLLLLLLIPCMMKGQDTTTANRSEYLYNSSATIGGITQATDTIRVMMLACDTARRLNGKESNDRWATINPYAYWQFGYSVSQVYYCCINGNTGNNAVYYPVPYYEHLYYLDEKYKPLPPSIIVWMSREIK